MDAQVKNFCVYIKLRNKTKPFLKTSILDYCKNKIAYYKFPKYMRNPITVTVKQQKFKMREEMNTLLKDPIKQSEFKIKDRK